MIRKFFAIVLILSLSVNIKAAIGDWNIHISYNDATYCQVIGNKIYVLASGALFSYNKEDGEVYKYDKINELSDYNISKITYCKDIDALLIVYKNSNIDILYSNGYVYNIIDFKNKIMSSKTINDIYLNGSTAYLSTSFGIVILNLDKLEFTNTYNLNLNTTCSYIYNNHMYIGTDDGIYKGDMNENLLDKAKWTKINNSKISAINEIENKLICVIDKKGAFTLEESGNISTTPIVANNKSFKYIYKENEKIYLGWEDKLSIINSLTQCDTYPVTTGTNFIAVDGERFWNCKGIKGLVENRLIDNTFIDGDNFIIPNSPVRNYCEFMNFTNNDKLLVAGGNINFFDNTFYPGTLYEYDYNNEKWINFPEDNIVGFTGVRYVNVCSITEDPREAGHYFAGSFGTGLYEFRNGELVAHYNHKNSPLQSPLPPTDSAIERYIRVPMVKYDAEGNLWIINTHVEDIIKVIKNDGNWITVKYDGIAWFETISDMFVDSRGWLWVTSMRGIPGAGLFCAKTNNTPFDTSDDQTNLWFNNFTNQDGTSYTIYYIYSVKEDRDGKIWVGTDNGLFVIEDAEEFFNNGIFTQVKVPRNDGTGLADYLFSGAMISAINFDGANRKWIGTKNNGIYLISADGFETIHHFTTENSPLPSNNITSIAINHKSGEVFIGTEGGIVSYMSDATEPEEKLQEGVVHAFPNPVKASYSGNITIVGLTDGCEIKIVDTAGYLITEGSSIGGMFSWNGRNAKGEKVASGVYYVLMYDKNGDESLATKILITR